MDTPERYVRRITWIGLVANILLSGIKFLAGVLGNSQALMADAVHSLSDTITDIAVILGSFFWSEPPDQCHPHGHQRIETMVTIVIGTMLLLAGVGVGWHSVTTLHLEESVTRPGPIALIVAAISLVTKEILYRWTDRAGIRVNSSALRANAWHHRLDAVSSIPVFLAVAGAMLFPNLTFLDHVGALIVSIFIVQASFKILLPGFGELLEAGASAETLAEIKSLAESHPEVIEIHKLRTRYLGSTLRIDFHLVVDGELTIRQGHDIAEKIKTDLISELPDLSDAIIHIEPSDLLDQDPTAPD
ncbi:MAG: cation transporter [Desulfobacteraceae bacterium]|nr:cation transporter [Desulfobacteraceae bacterium]